MIHSFRGVSPRQLDPVAFGSIMAEATQKQAERRGWGPNIPFKGTPSLPSIMPLLKLPLPSIVPEAGD